MRGQALTPIAVTPRLPRVRSGSGQGPAGETTALAGHHAGGMTTVPTMTRAGATSRVRSRARVGPLTPTERHGARLAAPALLALTVLAVLAARVADGDEGTASHVVVGSAVLVVAALDVTVGWGLYVLLGDRARPSAHATLVSRSGYAVLLVAASARLLWPGGDGLDGFRADWSLALLVLGLHLLIAAVAGWRSRVAPPLVVAAVALAGVASLLDDVLTRSTSDATARALVPVVLGELVLLGWLVVAGRGSRRPAALRARGVGSPGGA